MDKREKRKRELRILLRFYSQLIECYVDLFRELCDEYQSTGEELPDDIVGVYEEDDDEEDF